MAAAPLAAGAASAAAPAAAGAAGAAGAGLGGLGAGAGLTAGGLAEAPALAALSSGAGAPIGAAGAGLGGMMPAAGGGGLMGMLGKIPGMLKSTSGAIESHPTLFNQGMGMLGQHGQKNDQALQELIQMMTQLRQK